MLCELREQIHVARDEPVLRDDLHRIAEVGEDAETTPRDAEPAFDGLVRVGVGTQRNRMTWLAYKTQIKTSPIVVVNS